MFFIKKIRSSLYLPLLPLLVVGCGTTSHAPRTPSEYSFYDTTQSFVTFNETRRNGAVVDKGIFYPKSEFTFTYRYCSDNPQQAEHDVVEYQTLAKNVCNINQGQLIHQGTGTWCVSNANTYDEQPIFYARISSTDLWADLCLDGPFVTLKTIENTHHNGEEWFEAAQVLGYEPYGAERLLVPPAEAGTLHQAPPAQPAPAVVSEESLYISANPGATVCIFDKPPGSPYGYTYRGQVQSSQNGIIRALVSQKYKGDLRTAPAQELVPWHEQAYITAASTSWFVCS
ncbi:hypothetical protein ABT56_18000 [Photobacterium aquae]|uniref:Lipoprotein n=1 Tax=Photobacterium aquae TaxID=1195763 RepID=A0A0J1GVJ2_9GAMM|nr:hypothetical protein ABT56_18000 [Photobacterium aquae]